MNGGTEPTMERERSDAADGARASGARGLDLFRVSGIQVAVDPSWLTSAVVGLARGVYADRAFDMLPILADAIQDAGCEDEHLLGHCRRPGPHVRGCWAVDLLLGKE